MRAIATSFRHKTQVPQHACSVRLPICVSNPLIPLSRVMCFAFVRRTLAASTTIITTIASELKGGVALAVGATSTPLLLCGSIPVAAVSAGGGSEAA